ncbi:uncharacterized protein EV422DRAFT_513681 [Fimicolochytrium jonesii]|uniref:uncharacterized protein n=1 Tax=Fimicolochytrium jonesii TaxID=1396493 RepID=UPI0022FEB03C|nr:uncharacterized protein EV422DRAFT_513681 [Fimicolochytrium jonesii]KAI8825643.1 hypothetical protein EV422DRAFT_513681 [Fimicolochytrium jonesii]
MSGQQGADEAPRTGRLRSLSFSQKFGRSRSPGNDLNSDSPKSPSERRGSEAAASQQQQERGRLSSSGSQQSGSDNTFPWECQKEQEDRVSRTSRDQSRRTSIFQQSQPRSTPLEAVAESENERRIRIARVLTKQQKRISEHIQLFAKIHVTIVGSSINFDIIISRAETVEGLARMIEADYAYRYFYQEDGGPSRTVDSRRPDPLQIGQMYNAGQLALRFSDTVGDVLEYMDKVSVINSFEGESVYRNLTPRDESSSLQLTDKALSTSGESVNAQTEVATLATEDAYSPLPARKASTATAHTLSRQPGEAPPSLDDRIQLYLRNKMALKYLSEFCLEEYTIENLLFWIDVEVFQSSQASIRPTFARYIYLNYIAPGSPLQVNFSPEICRDLQTIIGVNAGNVDRTVFDEAQEQVYSMLKNHSFVRFEENSRHQIYMAARQSDGDTYQLGKIAGPFANHFQGSPELLKLVLPLLEKTASQNQSAPGKTATPQAAATTIKFREQMLNRVLVNYFPHFSRSVEGYFNEMNRNKWSSKQTRMNKEKRLAKFFGERPSVELVQQQIAYASASYLRSVQGITRESLEDLVGAAFSDADLADGDDGDVDESDPRSQSQRRKKKEKLEEFFGDRLPSQQKRVQQLVRDSSTAAATTNPTSSSWEAGDPLEVHVAAESLAPGETVNELDPEERRILQKRTKKIASMLGESLDEKTISKKVVHGRQEKEKATGIGPSTQALSGTLDNAASGGIGSTQVSASHSSTMLRMDKDASESEDDDPESKQAHKRRLDKISNLMGQRIGVTDIQTAKATVTNTPPVINRPLTLDEKKSFQKKASKLERVLGHLPPVEAIISTLPSGAQQKEVDHVRRSIVGLSFLVTNAKNAVDILDALTQITLPEERVGDAGDAAEGAYDKTPRGSVSGAQNPEENKESKKRKMRKLRKFFGDNIAVDMILETQILADLERSLQDLPTTSEEVDLLRAEVNNIRDTLRRRSGAFQEELHDTFDTSVASTGPSDGAAPGKGRASSISKGTSSGRYDYGPRRPSQLGRSSETRPRSENTLAAGDDADAEEDGVQAKERLVL